MFQLLPIRSTTVILMACISFSLTSCDEGSGTTAAAPTVASATKGEADAEKPESPKFEIEVTAKKYEADYKANEVAADEKYKGKKIKITGTVESIEKDVFDNPYVTLSTGDEFSMGVHCSFQDASDVRSLKKGQKIAVIGDGSGMSMTIPALDECKITQ